MLTKKYQKLTVKSTSKDSATCDEIVLRQTNTTRMVFIPQLVCNNNNPKASVRGIFVFQRKNLKEQWEDCEHIDLNSLKAGDGVKLELKSQELSDFFSHIEQLYKLYEEHGIIYGRKKFFITDSTLGDILEQIATDDKYLQELFSKNESQVVFECIKQLSFIENLDLVLDKLKQLDINCLEKLNSLVGITTLSNVLSIWESNKDNDDEEFWHDKLRKNSWVISQVFSCPTIIFEDKVYLGGKGMNNKGGKVVDFVYQNELTDNVMIVEIKTPTAKLIGAKYRDNVYSTHAELSGAINQVLTYKDALQKNFHALRSDSDKNFYAFNPKAVVIAGTLDEDMLEEDKKKSFELLRQELKDVEVVTFDELFYKVRLLLDLLQQK